MKLESYRTNTAPPFISGAVGPVPEKADAGVIGAGFTGLAAARRACRRAGGRTGRQRRIGAQWRPMQ